MVKTLPEEQANLVLMFTQFVRQQASQLQDELTLMAPVDLLAQLTLVNNLSGNWADLPEVEA
ncbi:hypothetical protein [Leptolyngbya sp. PCC 6406]|uniref:hypothetical protein n=1 Tax=Leptolyngbya sp. PCC 6406 TaxID=1173264 RepID=UPI0002D55992|nr:hypothetical protein [Leptolyngbya sp. PCC 6406]